VHSVDCPFFIVKQPDDCLAFAWTPFSKDSKIKLDFLSSEYTYGLSAITIFFPMEFLLLSSFNSIILPLVYGTDLNHCILFYRWIVEWREVLNLLVMQLAWLIDFFLVSILYISTLCIEEQWWCSEVLT
jgi:hypothetical protein